MLSRATAFRKVVNASLVALATTAVVAATSTGSAVAAPDDTPTPPPGASAPPVDTQRDPKIIGGDPVTNPSAYPWMAFLQVQGSDNLWYSCGGTLISPTKVLTAAHCVDGFDYVNKGVVIFGGVDLEVAVDRVVHPTEQWRHPDFEPNQLANDVAVLTLPAPVPYQVLPIAGPADSALYAAGTQAQVFGWGRSESGRPADGKLRKATIPLLGPDGCTALPGEQTGAGMICAGDGTGTVTPCNGDSGGPLVVAGRVVGIVSWGVKGCVTPGTYSVSTKVSDFTTVINQQLGTRPLGKPDLDADGLPDLYGRTPGGELWTVTNYGEYGLYPDLNAGNGWNMFTKMYQPGDLNGDSQADVLGLTSGGDLYYYQGVGNGYLGTKSNVGNGWNMFDTILTPGDLNGDRRPDLLGRTPTGDLFFYPGTGPGAFGERQFVGNGWNMFNQMVVSGDLDRDGKVDILGRTPGGLLRFYKGFGGASFGNGVTLGTGWDMFSQLIGAGDVNRDGVADIVGKTSNGRLFTYYGTGAPSFGERLENGIISGQPNLNWNVFDNMF